MDAEDSHPGPWRFNADKWDGVIYANESTGPNTARLRTIARDVFGLANAHLIAEAPELFGSMRELNAATCRLYHALRELSPDHPELSFAHTALARSNASLRKARPAQAASQENQ